MNSSENTVKEFLSGSGQHHTDVDETVNPAVTTETIKPHRHEETTQAIDREVHQHHYHTTVQPLQHQEVLPERHTHNVVAGEERVFEHGDAIAEKERAAAELAQFQNASTVQETQHSLAQLPEVAGEHIHHHVHEHVQPIIHKETLQPEVVHTTVPIHETHHAPAEHHGISQLPARSLADFTASGGNLTGTQGQSHHEEYQGHPKQYNPDFQLERHPVDIEPRKHDGTHDLASTGHIESGSSGHGTAGPHDSNLANKVDPRVDSDRDHRGLGRDVEGLAGAGAVGAGVAGISGDHNGTTHHGYNTGSSSLGAGSSTSAPGTTAQGYETGEGFGSTGRSGSHNPAAMGAGVAGVGAGAVAADLARDHRRAGDNTDMTSNDITGRVGDSGTSTSGTALAGRGEPNTSTRATDAYNQSGTDSTTGSHHHHDHHHAGRDAAAAGAAGIGATGAASELERSRDTNNTNMSEQTPVQEQTSRSIEAESGNKGSTSIPDDGLQHASQQGRDPAVEGDTKNIKLTGSGVDGSHSAVFGLTPDGHKHTDTAHGSTPIKPAHSDDTAVGGGKPSTDDSNTGSQGVSGSGVAEQMHDPSVAEKGHGGKAVESETTGAEKPGAGGLPEAGSQGTGDVKPAENSTGPASEETTSSSGGFMGKVRSFMS